MQISILSKFRFGVDMIIAVYAAVYQPCKPCQLSRLAYHVPAAFLIRLCEYEITAVIAVQSIFIVVVVGLAEVNTVRLVDRSREFVIAYFEPPRLRTSVELVCDPGEIIGIVQDVTVVCFSSAGSHDRNAVSERDLIYVRIGYSFLFFCKAVVVIQLAFVITCDFADELIYLSRSLRIYRFSGSVSTQVRRNPPDLL